jgi:hypothetical protein
MYATRHFVSSNYFVHKRAETVIFTNYLRVTFGTIWEYAVIDDSTT